MKSIGRLLILVSTLALVACGGSTKSSTSTTNPGNGAWTATFTSSSSQQLGTMTFNMAQNNLALSGSGMNFANLGSLSQCFGSGTVMTGEMGQGMMNGGTMRMTMSWTPQGSTATNTMVMQGNMALGMGSGSGTFTLTAETPGCTSQAGSFTMTHASR